MALSIKISVKHVINYSLNLHNIKFPQNSTSASSSKSTMVFITYESNEYSKTTEFLNFG